MSGSGTAARAGVPAGAISICNEALALLGANTITDFTDNTQEARLVDQFFYSAIKDTLRDYDWAFATKRSSDLAELDGRLFSTLAAVRLAIDANVFQRRLRECSKQTLIFTSSKTK